MNCFNHSPKEFGFKRQHDDCDFKHFDKAILGLSFLGGLLIEHYLAEDHVAIQVVQLSRLTVTLIQCTIRIDNHQ